MDVLSFVSLFVESVVLPAAAQAFVKGNSGQELISLRAGQIELCGEELLLGL